MKTPFLALLSILCGFSCKKSTDNAVVIDAIVNIQIVDGQNKNLIGEASSVYFNDLKIYYLIDENKELFYRGNFDYPRGYALLEDANGEKYLRLFLNTQGELPVTLIQFNDTDIDTIECEFIRKNGNINCAKIWYNDVLEWNIKDKNSSENREITIIKAF